MSAHIISIPKTGSTNADMLAMARDGVAEGTWLRAQTQTDGRGRMGRRWESPSGNLFTSTLVRHRAEDPPANGLAFVAAVAVHQTLDRLLPDRFRLKWPNDILAGSAKISGMLLERERDAVVVGIGINVTGHPTDLDRPATSLWTLGAVETEANTLLAALASDFIAWLTRWRGQGLEPIRGYWLDHAHPIGTPLAAALPDGTRIEGIFETLDPSGSLILRLENGRTRAIHAGDIFLI